MIHFVSATKYILFLARLHKLIVEYCMMLYQVRFVFAITIVYVYIISALIPLSIFTELEKMFL